MGVITNMNPDGDFEFYRFIWSGADQGWGVYSYPPMHGIKIVFQNERPSAIEIKAIRSGWPRLRKKTITEAKAIIGQESYTFGKWSFIEAGSILNTISPLGVKATLVHVPNYSIVNMKTRQGAQIRNKELYDLVTQKLIDTGGEIILHSGIYPSGAIAVDPE